MTAQRWPGCHGPATGHRRTGDAGRETHALEPLEARIADLDHERLRTAMGAEAFEAEYAIGRTLTGSRSLICRSQTR